MLRLDVKVYNDGRLVFIGNLEDFLKDNKGDLDLLAEVEKLDFQDYIEFNFYHSGEWRIEKI